MALKIDLPVKKIRIAATTFLKWITKDRSVSSYLAHRLSVQGANCACNKYEGASLARSIDLTMKELGWKVVVKAKFMEVHARRLLALQLVISKGSWEIASKIEENHVGHEVNEDVLIQRAYKQHKLENQLGLQHVETKSDAGPKHQYFKSSFPVFL